MCLPFPLSIFIVPLALFFQGDYSSVFLTSIRQRRMNSRIYICGEACSPALSYFRAFGKKLSRVTTFKYSPACDLYHIW